MIIPDLILKPFAASAGSLDVKEPPQSSPSGFVNFTDGYTSFYEISLAAGNPQAKAVERPIQNYLFGSLYKNSNAWQAQCTPPWYANMVGGYIKNAKVLRVVGANTFIYRSLVDGNVADPIGNPTLWEYEPTAAEALKNVPMPAGGPGGPSAAIITVAVDFNTILNGTFEIRTPSILTASPNSPTPPFGTAFGRGMIEAITWATDGGNFTLQRFTDVSGGSAVRSGVAGTFGAWRYTTSYRDIQSGESVSASMANGPVAYTATLVPNPPALTLGMEVRLLVNVNCGDAPTLNLNGLGAKPIIGGANLGAKPNEIVSGRLLILVYSTASGGHWRINGQSAGPVQVSAAVDATHAPQAQQVQKDGFNFALDTTSSATPGVYGATYAPAVTSFVNGMPLRFQAQLASPGPSTFSPNGLTPKPILDSSGAVLAAGSITTGGMCQVVYSLTADAWILQYASGATQTAALPLGAIVDFPKGTVPTGFLELDGSVQSTATYPDLSSYLGTTYNTGGEGAGLFRLPDTRGEFIRGWDHGRGVDAGRAIGSKQKGTVHSFDMGSSYTTMSDFVNTSTPATAVDAIGMDAVIAADYPSIVGWNANSATTSGQPLTLSSEVSFGAARPRNIAFMRCIKAFGSVVNQGAIDVAAIAAAQTALSNLSLSSHKGLSITTTGLSAIVSVKARLLVVGDGPSCKRIDNLAVSINLASSGVGGLDSGAVAAASWYSIWAVTNGTVKSAIAALMPSISCTSTAGSPVVTGIASTSLMRAGMQMGGVAFAPGSFILSVDSPTQITLSAPALFTGTNPARFVYEPVVPVGYVFSRIGSVLTDGTANKYPFSTTQTGNIVQYKVAVGTNTIAPPTLVSGALAKWSAVSTVTAVPPTAQSIKGSLYNFANLEVAIAPSNHWVNAMASCYTVGGSGAFAAQFDIILESAYVYGYIQAASGAIYCTGWEEQL